MTVLDELRAADALIDAQKAAILARAQSELARSTLMHAVAAAAARGESQRAIADRLGRSQPYVNELIQKAHVEGEIPEGRLGYSPLDVARRYAVGQIGREQLIEQLVTWPYTPPSLAEQAEWSDVSFRRPGDLEELSDALRIGYLDGDLYDEIGHRLAVRG